MVTNAGNARVFGSDLDAVYLAPIGTTLPTTIDGDLDAAFEDVGWLHSDGINETFTGSKTEIRGHQGAGVVRSRMESPGTQFTFNALESKAQTKALRYDEKAVDETTAGVRKVTRRPGQTIKARACVIDVFDADDTTIKERWVFERIEVAPDSERVFVNSDIAGFPFIAEVIGEYESFESVPVADEGE